jgi:hypothetical protein
MNGFAPAPTTTSSGRMSMPRRAPMSRAAAARNSSMPADGV